MLPSDPEEVRIEPSKHFRNLRMRRWDWDVHDIRDALRKPVRVERQGRTKWAVWVRKDGSKKLVMAYDPGEKLVLVITGTEG
ncbi:MAG: hypothetical protein ACHQ2Y_03410 [Candidatus Lutacidiplasmatales archaeon]